MGTPTSEWGKELQSEVRVLEERIGNLSTGVDRLAGRFDELHHFSGWVKGACGVAGLLFVAFATLVIGVIAWARSDIHKRIDVNADELREVRSLIVERLLSGPRAAETSVLVGVEENGAVFVSEKKTADGTICLQLHVIDFARFVDYVFAPISPEGHIPVGEKEAEPRARVIPQHLVDRSKQQIAAILKTHSDQISPLAEHDDSGELPEYIVPELSFALSDNPFPLLKSFVKTFGYGTAQGAHAGNITMLVRELWLAPFDYMCVPIFASDHTQNPAEASMVSD